MPKVHHPRRGSMQYWPRKRSTHSLVRIRSWAKESRLKPLGFIGYKAGMTQIMVSDNRPKSTTKGEQICLPVTIIECPPLFVSGVSFYNHAKKVASILAPKLPKETGRRIQLPKKAGKTLDSIKPDQFSDLKILVQTQPHLASSEAKRPKMLEIALGGSKEDKLNYAKQFLGKEIKISDVVEKGNSVDVHAITKGKGFQGTVKRFGVPIRQHKAEKTKRGIATLGSWTPKRVEFPVPNSGKMGFHQRTEYNKQVLKIGDKGEDVNPTGGINKYGLVKNTYLLLKGSVAGVQKREVVITISTRPDRLMYKEAPEITSISRTTN